ncbi:hypothetical protein L1987_15845 [Smallanthus sonchifolius]|uniref:Uncharacterized protein n=1 Tax=Smallanthus sonchifolius TaxID=185202 RepID=A0ACB9J9C9_9ASTR|nr:hypothetical protein L1987_15845 [Smallanthus sonchifolius]
MTRGFSLCQENGRRESGCRWECFDWCTWKLSRDFGPSVVVRYETGGRFIDWMVNRLTHEKVEVVFNQLLGKERRLRGEVSQDVCLALDTFWQVDGGPANPEEVSLFNWHLANLEYANMGV